MHMTRIIGLTGRSGSGKHEVGVIFEKYGIPCLDTDAIYHELLQEKNACTRELTEAFGTQILNENGLVDRKRLADTVFGKKDTPTLLHTLNEITHKYIMARTYELVRTHAQNNAKAVVIDAPLLFEAGVDKECDLTLAVLAPLEICIARIMARDAISREAAHRRLAAQHPDDFFVSHCTATVTNNGDLESLELQIHQFLKKYGVITD
jgi:dephospho-CoA kinase